MIFINVHIIATSIIGNNVMLNGVKNCAGLLRHLNLSSDEDKNINAMFKN